MAGGVLFTTGMKNPSRSTNKPPAKVRGLSDPIGGGGGVLRGTLAAGGRVANLFGDQPFCNLATKESATSWTFCKASSQAFLPPALASSTSDRLSGCRSNKKSFRLFFSICILFSCVVSSARVSTNRRKASLGHCAELLVGIVALLILRTSAAKSWSGLDGVGGAAGCDVVVCGG